ncbi:autotransporter domain-containing protein [Bartonella pachyuromydis]|uniref:autotransporter domain-containing protein n=1 Tax=Bartonella pachyuromydis TaxID=931097 RepID=UPI003CD0BD3E
MTISGGSFDAKLATIQALNGSIITLTDKAQITSYKGNGIYAGASGSQVIMTGGTIKSEANALFAKNSGHIKVTNVSIATNGTGTGAVALGPDSTIELSGTTMKNVFSGLTATNGGKITSENLTVIGGKAINSDSDSDPDTERSGVTTEDAESEINLTGTTTIQNVDEGLYADGGSKITSGDLTIIGGESKKITSAVGSYEPESKIELNGKTTIKSFDLGLSAANGSSINMKNGTKNEIDVKKVALSAAFRGKIDLANTVVKAGSIGMQLMALSKTNTNKLDDLQTSENNEINLTNTNIHVDNGTGILIGALAEKSVENSPALSIGTLNLKDSEIHADMLLDNGIFWNQVSGKDKNFWKAETMKEISTGTFTLSADHSILEGRAKIAHERNVRFDLKNNTQWFLKTSTQEKDENDKLLDIALRSRSDISVLDLENSSVIFKEPTADGYYHTLHIGYGKPDTSAVYNATGNAQISFNTLWSDGKPIIEQKTDRLLIYGDVSGNTNVFVAGYVTKNNSQENNSKALDNIRGLSLIQVSGKAEEGSFKLVNGYTTLNGSPNKYTLLAYGPNSSHGNAEASQNLVGNSDNFWDFRLQPEFLNTNPENPNTNPENPNTNPENPNTNPNNPNTNPNNPNTNPDNPNTNPDNPNTNPDNPNTNPDNPNTTPDNPSTNPENPNTNPDNPSTNPENPNTNPDNPNTNPDNPNTNPDNPNTNPSGSGSNSGSTPDPEQNVHAVVPQMASYLLMPNALFYSGLTDMAKQNALLANIRTSLFSKQQEKQSGFFLYTYGSTGNFSSENAPRQYGYSGAHLRYAALQGGVNFTPIEGQNTTTNFGLVGTYGQLSFTPQNMKDASKSTVDKWFITAYGSIQHNNGVYLDTLLSYGVLKGDITNAIIGTTAKLKNAKMWSVSTTVGKQFATGIQGVIFEPQAQLAYQHLMFDTISDADHFTIDMNNPHQWMIRVGGRLTKTVTSAENGRTVSFYGKVNAIKIFDDNQAIHIDKDYKLDPMGSLLEGGVGINAQLSSNVSLHGDVSYQQKLQKTGISGASFSGGIRYRF